MLAQQTLIGLITQALLQAPPVAGGNVYRHRGRPIAEDITQAVNVRTARALPQALVGAGAPTDWTTTVAIECMARFSASEGAADEAVGPVVEAVHARLGAALPTLEAAGFTLDLQPQMQWDSDDADDRVGVVVLFYPVTHRTAYKALSA